MNQPIGGAVLITRPRHVQHIRSDHRSNNPNSAPRLGGKRAEAPNIDPLAIELAKVTGGQQIMKLSVRVVDADGNPVADAKVTPWALRSSRATVCGRTVTSAS